MKKRIVSLLVGGVIAVGATAGMTACGKDNGLTIWAPNNQQTLVKELVQDFLNENPDFGIEVKYGVCGEDNAYAQLSVDPAASADIYGFANDQLMNLRKVGGLARLNNAAVEAIKASDDANAVDAGKIGDAYYGYPYAADNGFFMYYDSSVVTAEAAQTLEGVLEACKTANKYFIFRMNNQCSWYVGSFFYGAGGDYTMDWDGSTLMSAESDFATKKAKNAAGAETEYTVGQVGAQGLIDLRKHENFLDGDDGVIDQYLSGGKLGAVITGTWNAAKIKAKWGNNYAATKCPTYHSSLTDTDYQIVPFIGYKLFAVNSNSKHLTEAHKLAAYLSSEKAQQKRFDVLGIGPSNKALMEKKEVKENVALSAVYSQKPFAKVQPTLPSNYWSALDAFGTEIYSKGGATTAEERDTLLTTLISSLADVG